MINNRIKCNSENIFVKIKQIGPSAKSRGGVASVVNIFEEKLLMSNIPTYISDNKNKHKIFMKSILLLLASLNKYDFYHIHLASKGSFYRKYILSILLRLFRKKYALHLHGGLFDEFYYNSSKHMQKKIVKFFNHSSGIIVLSSSKKEFVESLTNNYVVLMSNPVIDTFSNNINITNKYIFVGKINYGKGALDLLEAIDKCRFDEIVFEFYGNGEIENANKIVNMKKLQNVSIYGWTEKSQLIKKMKESDLLLLPSYAENVPMSILEAMANGLAIIATDVGGISTLVKNGVNGYLITPGDIDDLNEKIEYLYNNPKVLIEMKKKSVQIIEETFSFKQYKKAMKKFYENIFDEQL